MKMWQPDGRITGPYPAREAEIGELNRLFAEAFTDRYRRDGLVGVRVPPLNPAVWTYALRDAGTGAMIWRDEQETLIAFNIAHHSGTEGWMGPLATRPDRQGLGVGRAIVEAAIDWLKAAGVTTLGLETMPRTVDNIGFYSRLGFLPGHLTVTLGGDVSDKAPRRFGVRLGDLPPDERADLVARCQARLERAAPGYDFTRELELTHELGIGDTVVLERGGAIEGFALWHSAALADARAADELRVLKLFAASRSAFEDLLRAAETAAARLRLRRVAVRCQARYAHAYEALMARRYDVRWTDLRMTLVGFPEATPPGDEIVFSNWEI
ncbi:MAG: GNAT family N-acetyltransferase [Gemmatimonadota bacterium]|nr:GNAT family N-acetyltransferase [Gemmatimonadota bacterium]